MLCGQSHPEQHACQVRANVDAMFKTLSVFTLNRPGNG
jgi:hypothetical protein